MSLTIQELTANEINSPVTRIRPSRGWVALKLRDVWAYRELLYFLVWRDVKVRYKQTVLGATWAIIQPFMTMVVFSIFFGRLANIPSDGIPYPIFSYAALVPWTFFANGFDVILNLATGGEALYGLDSIDRPDNCLVWTLCGVPAINLPVFAGPNGLPFGVQIVARRYSDYLLLAFARALAARDLIPAQTFPTPALSMTSPFFAAPALSAEAVWSYDRRVAHE